MVDRATPSHPTLPTAAAAIPNLVSFARLAGVPLFLWLFLGVEADGWAVAVLAIGGTSDWVDGFLARRLGQVSRLGEMLDPLADRLYILATLLALTIRDVLPWWFTIALLAREAVLLVSLAVLRRYGYRPWCRYIGKTATFILLVAFPTLLLAACRQHARLGVPVRLGAGLVGPGSVLGRGRVLPRANRRGGAGGAGVMVGPRTDPARPGRQDEDRARRAPLGLAQLPAGALRRPAGPGVRGRGRPTRRAWAAPAVGPAHGVPGEGRDDAGRRVRPGDRVPRGGRRRARPDARPRRPGRGGQGGPGARTISRPAARSCAAR